MSGRHNLVIPAGLHSRRGLRILLAITVTLIALAITGTAALAYWTSHGSGSGSSTTGTLTINVTALAGGDANQTSLLPGSTGDVIIRVNNPNSSSVHVTSIASNGNATANNGCTPTGVTFTAPSDYSAAQFTLSPGSSLLRLAGAVAMSSASASTCQGATFTLPVSVTVQR
jgi:hypothetical protein